MKVLLKREEFLKELRRVAAIIPNKPMYESSLYVLLYRDDISGNLCMQANNIEVIRRTSIKTDPGNGFPRLFIPARRIIDYLFRITEDDIELEPDNSNAVTIYHGQKKAKFNCLSLSCLPSEMNSGKVITTASVDGIELRRLLSQVLFACSNNHTTKAELTGINVHILPNRIIMAATDARVIAQSVALANASDNIKFLVPGRHMNDLLKALRDEKYDITIKENTIIFSSDSLYQESVGLNGQHPINSSFFKLQDELANFNIERETLISSLDRMMPLLDNPSSITDAYKVFMNLDNKDMHIETVSKELGEIKDTIKISQLANSCTFKVDARSMISVCKALDTDQLDVKLGKHGCILSNLNNNARYIVLLVS